MNAPRIKNKGVSKFCHSWHGDAHSVDYSRITSVLVEAVKEQQEQIEELKAKLSKDNS
jgi:hypothetical protein